MATRTVLPAYRRLGQRINKFPQGAPPSELLFKILAILKPRAARVVTPVDTAYRVVLMAVERGVLQNLIFDNQALLRHQVLAVILGCILKLPPLKQALASRQLQSVFIDALTDRWSRTSRNISRTAALPQHTVRAELPG
ncbi:MAG: hypothetical protein WAL90_11655 [Desulfobacterales bacterium]